MRSGRPVQLAFGLGLALWLLACRENPLVPDPNRPPTAVATIVGPDGVTVLEPLMPCVDPKKVQRKTAHTAKFDYMGSDVEVTLDGSKSTDDDGKIVTYRWLSGSKVGDGGVGPIESMIDVTTADGDKETKTFHGGTRAVPDGQPADWPDDHRKVTLSLGVGVWRFVLWTIDDKGAISQPDTIEIAIVSGMDPRVAECVGKVYSPIGDSCKQCICAASDMCRMSVIESACDQTCWGLINCIATMCPDFIKNTSDTSCVVAMCGPFLGGAAGATPAGACVAGCQTECASSAMGGSMGDGGTGDGGMSSGGTGDAGTSSSGMMMETCDGGGAATSK